MTYKEAKESIGKTVLYHSHQRTEEGILIRVTKKYAFVKYGTDEWAKATCFEDLELKGGDEDGHFT
jgi:hypothetical protein